MLTSIRKVQRSVLIVVTAIICIAFAYLYTEYDTGASGGGTYTLTVDGEPYGRPEVTKMANLFYVAFGDLGRVSMFNFSPLGEFALTLFGPDQMNDDRTNFVVNLITLRNAAEEMGIDASPEEIDEAIQNLGAFSNPATGGFDRAAYDDYIRTRLGRYSMVEADLRQLMADYVKFTKIRQLVGSGMRPLPLDVDRAYRERYEAFTVRQLVLNRAAAVLPEAAITDEAIAEYFENNQDMLLTEPKRSFSYIRFPIPEPAEGEGAEQTRAKRLEVAKEFNEVFRRISAAIDDEGKPVEEAVKLAEGYEVRTSGEPFPQSAPPLDLAEEVSLIQGVFDLNPSFGTPLNAAETQNAIYLYWLGEVMEPRLLTLEEAREEITGILRRQEEELAMQTIAAEKRTELLALIEGGATMEDAAAKLGWETKTLPPFTRAESPVETEFSTSVRSLATELQQGELSQPQVFEDAALLVYLEKKELPARESEPEDRQNLAESLRARRVAQAFTAWFSERQERVEAKFPMARDEEGKMVPVSVEQIARI